ncbi:MAG: alpha/beta hydrolase [Eubacterium sp.]|nr:alpha/beta hydrolase [Eubacterium sp.]
MKKKLAVIFPGIGYHTDKPLLYFSKKLASGYGYEILDVSYGGFGSGIKGDAGKMRQAFEEALTQTEKILEGTGWDREDILFVSKSVGTAVASAYALKHGLHPRFIYFTPVEASFQVMQEPCIVFHGDQDPWLDHQIFREKIRETGFSYHVVKGANHSLETENVDMDLTNLQEIMRQADGFVRKCSDRIK